MGAFLNTHSSRDGGIFILLLSITIGQKITLGNGIRMSDIGVILRSARVLWVRNFVSNGVICLRVFLWRVGFFFGGGRGICLAFSSLEKIEE